MHSLTLDLQCVDLYRHWDRQLSLKTRSIIEATPVGCKACHVICGQGRSVINMMLPVLKHILGLRFRLRMKLHEGHDGLLFSTFREFGLDDAHVEMVEKRSHCVAGYVERWLAERRRLEQG